MNQKLFLSYLMGCLIILAILGLPYLIIDSEKNRSENTVRVLTYSSFINKWGPGPEIAQKFFESTGTKVEWINAGNAGLIIERLKFKKDSDAPDIIIGFDQFSVFEARRNFEWLDLREEVSLDFPSQLPGKSQYNDFVAYDWGPLSFVYREGEVEPAKRLEDLTSEQYKDQIILQDPRMSSPGLQFLLWVLTAMGEEKGFEFLKNLKPSIKIMSPSWSSSYSIFKMEKPSLVFSYFSSPFYHLIEEGESQYKSMPMDRPHPVQVEYMGIPKFCGNCQGAAQFAQFLLTTEIQKIIMSKNYMFPVDQRAMQGSGFKLPDVEVYKPIESLSLIKRKRELINKWKKVFY
jgi:thiamine transport system substrate-binding protein